MIRSSYFGKFSCSGTSFASLIAMTVVCSWALALGTVTWAAPPSGGAVAMTAAVTGKEAELNGAKMAPGATLFPGDLVRVGPGSTSALWFGENSVLMAPETELVVEAAGLKLRNGKVQVRTAGDKKFDVDGQYFQVRVTGTNATPGLSEIRIEGERAQVTAKLGFADLSEPGSDEVIYKLRPGETANLEPPATQVAAAQNAVGQEAGKVEEVLPVVQIERPSEKTKAVNGEIVLWNDNLVSGQTGRAHVMLNDGSLLYLSSNSNLRILQHDAQAQQTVLDLIIGRLRAKVMKLTQPGGRFEIHTPVGVAGLVGTDFSLLVTSDFVELQVFEGEVRFTLLNGQSVSVGAGMLLHISRAGVIAPLRQSTPQETQTAKSETDITPEQVRNSQNNQNRNAALVVSIGTGVVVIGVSAYLDTHERPPMSPVRPRVLPPSN